jgi:LuxR family maltose regulon positive regulatory protein
MGTPILTTKIHIPSLRRNLVSRQRLLEQLDEGLHRRLTLVSAPAGFGKTTLLGEWVQDLEGGRAPGVRVAWISLDDGDNDPARFSAYLIAALGQADESSMQASAAGLESTGSWLQELQLVKLINQVAARPQDWVLVLDDYHLITSQTIHDALTFLVDHLPASLHLILASRADPPLPLPRLRARGHLTELRQSDLRFTTEEAAAFLNNVMGLGLSAGDVAALETRTEGWIAGLQMASLALQARLSPGEGQDLGRSTRAELVRALTGSHRFFLDYLIEEVLEQQPPTLQEFLLQTSILERLSGPLCDWVTGKLEHREPEAGPDILMSRFPDSQSVLEHLEAANLFVVPLDDERRWYRYHRLFADLLRRQLGQRSQDLMPALHRRASVWHEQQGFVSEAIDHALVAHDFERAADLIEERAEATFMRSEVATFLGWMEQLPDEEVRRRPTLCFFHAWGLLMRGRSLDTVDQRLGDLACIQAGEAQGGVIGGRMAAFRAYLMVFRGDMHQAAELGQEALELLPESDRFLRSIVAWILSLARLADGDLQDGKQALREVAQMGQELGNPMITVTALCHQAKLQARQGRLHRAKEILERALQMVTDSEGGRLPIASEALIGLGELEREWNNLEAAAGHLAEGIALARQWSEMAAFDAYFPLLRVRLAQGDVEGAREALDTARQIAKRSEATELDDLVSELQQAHFATAAGNLAAVMHWAESRGLVSDGSLVPYPSHEEGQDFIRARLRKYEQLILARLFIRQGRAGEALDLLAPLLPLAKELSRIDLTIEIHILRALACQAEGQDTQAMAALESALSLAEPSGYVRIFLDEGASLARLLRQAASLGIAPAYVATLLAAYGGPEVTGLETPPTFPPAQPLVEPLSARELEVLRLLATGLSNPEIADELYIAVSTVRSHCKSIYGKLNVHKRWDAVQRGQDLGLIP